jgi:serine protease Do
MIKEESKAKGSVGVMSDRDRLDSTEDSRTEPASAYSDAYYRKAPETGHACYGYSPVQCYTRPTDGDSSPKGRQHTSTGVVAGLCVVCVLVALLVGFGGTFFVFRANAAEASQEAETDDLYAQYAQTSEGSANNLFQTLSSSETQQELTAEEIYTVACRSAVGVTIPGKAYNIFGQTSASTVTGSGIVLSEDGYILTNYHVIEDAYSGGSTIQVITYEGDEYTAQVVGVETDSDLAVLKIDAMGLIPAELGNSDDMRVGQTIYALGNPLGELTYTMTSGIVSALDRQITTDVNVTVNMFQIDAAVNSGNSGGPVLNVYGQVIGVVTAKYSQSGMEGLGFAIPINDAASIASELVTNGYVTGKAYLGLTLTTVSASVAKYYNMVQGVYVYSVEPDSCAEKAGLRIGDIITAIDDTQVTTNTELVQQVKNYRAGDSASLTVYRDQNYITVTVVFDEELPAEQMTDEEVVLQQGGDVVSQAFRGR